MTPHSTSGSSWATTGNGGCERPTQPPAPITPKPKSTRRNNVQVPTSAPTALHGQTTRANASQKHGSTVSPSALVSREAFGVSPVAARAESPGGRHDDHPKTRGGMSDVAAKLERVAARSEVNSPHYDDGRIDPS